MPSSNSSSSTEIQRHPSAGNGPVDEKKASYGQDDVREGLVEVSGNADSLKRHLGNRQISLIAIGGTIGTGKRVVLRIRLLRSGVLT